MTLNPAIHLPWAGAACAGVLALVGAAVAPRRDSARWAFAAGMLALGAEAFCAGWTARPLLAPESLLAWEQARMAALALAPGCWLWFSLSYARGNAGEFLARWRPFLAAAFLVPVAVFIAGRRALVTYIERPAPEEPWRFGLGWSGLALDLLLLAGSIIILVNLERTFRASVGTMRWRIKAMLSGVGLIFVFRIYEASQELLFRAARTSLNPLDGGFLVVAGLLALVSFVRTGRTGIDVYPSPFILRGSLTILFAGVYLVIVGIGARVVAALGGGEVFALESFLILLSLIGLVALLQSDRLRMQLRGFVSRHFQRPLYDYREVWRRFNEVTTAQLDQAELCRSLVRLTAEVFQCLSVAIWIVDERALRLAASTAVAAADGTAITEGEEADAILAHFQAHSDPADVEHSRAGWADALRRLHPSEFPGRENRVALALVPRGRVAALMILGDRVGGVPFRAQDYDLLRCVGEHAAASLLQLQLARRLVQSKELEAFQAMAAFFVHDLKNAANTLGLMLENLPVHFEDPAFREDALRGVGKSVSHINHLISRLTQLRQELKIAPVPTDLNALVNETLAGLGADPNLEIRRELAEMPPVALDREQMSKVITNLVLNAKEAMSGRGEVRVETHRDRGWAVLSVSDHGCGMSPDFMARSLFKPFQTTKKNGLGIGMFQSRMIVEVHGGRMAVNSQEGIGTNFQVLLPVQGSS